MNQLFISRGAKILNCKGKIDWLSWAAYSRKLYVFGNVRASETYEKVLVTSCLTRPRESFVCRLELYLKSRDEQRCQKSKCREALRIRLCGYFRPPCLILFTSGPPFCGRHKVCTSLTSFLPISSRLVRRRIATPFVRCSLSRQSVTHMCSLAFSHKY